MRKKQQDVRILQYLRMKAHDGHLPAGQAGLAKMVDASRYYRDREDINKAKPMAYEFMYR
ncbi:hypothetical protein ED312_14500 [Sinomicrobium pectinilyticum]|uniref:Uncharacterized protein n=1 Tax=Sinomicrobium pectinilyticum TaxID=1084421 RepID=A0A3N0E7T7_SINP1|nr:hypothetical protein ED312_14500 [Sinomicrobium pectinilyticum]